MDTPLAELADALQRFRHGGVEEGDLSAATADRPARRARAALPHRPARVHQHREGLPRGRGLPRALPAHRLPAAQPRAARGQGGRPLPRLEDRGPLARVPRRARRHPGPAQLVHPLGRDPRLHPPQRPRGRLQPEVHATRTRSGSSTRYIVQLFKNSFFSAGHPARAVGRARRPRRTGRSSSAARACSRTASGSAFSGKYKSLFLANSGTKRERLAALTDAIAEVYASVFGPDPIEYRARARPARPPRGDGHPDPGGGGHAGRALLPAGLLRRRLQQQRVPLVAADPPRGRPAAHRARPRHAGRGPPRRRLPGAGGARPARAARQPDARGGPALLAEEGGRHQPGDRRLRDRGRAGAPASSTATSSRSCAR